MRNGTYEPSLDQNRQRVRKLSSEHRHTHTRTFFFAIPSNRIHSLRSLIQLQIEENSKFLTYILKVPYLNIVLTSTPMLQVTFKLVECKVELPPLLRVVKVEDSDSNLQQEQKVIFIENLIVYYAR